MLRGCRLALLSAACVGGFVVQGRAALRSGALSPLPLSVEALADCGRALEAAGAEQGWPDAADGAGARAAGAELRAIEGRAVEDWEDVADTLFAASQSLARAGAFQECADALRAAADVSGCLSVGPPAAAPDVERAAEALLCAARGLGYSAAGARLEEAGDLMAEFAAACGGTDAPTAP
ncbi:hypothetical protein M885DRAFT_506596 [Pelagophyceae sp. CCMP2097]|nr:hypothetical protein M885DRAFT_506596 [Pelagophyceae sp. CCMP2097]